MPSIEITDDHQARLERLREELAQKHSGQYSSVTVLDVVTYLCDLAEAVDDPDREADIEPASEPASELASESAVDQPATDTNQSAHKAFPRDQLEECLRERNQRHADPEESPEMDLYSIAVAYDIAGRSGMSKPELIEAILATAEQLYLDPFAQVDIEFPSAREQKQATDQTTEDSDASTDDPNATETAQAEDDGADTRVDDQTDATDGADGQLNAMLSLLDTHNDKWWHADGEARYEVQLPDGSTKTARTKDDVRAVLFKNY